MFLLLGLLIACGGTKKTVKWGDNIQKIEVTAKRDPALGADGVIEVIVMAVDKKSELANVNTKSEVDAWFSSEAGAKAQRKALEGKGRFSSFTLSRDKPTESFTLRPTKESSASEDTKLVVLIRRPEKTGKVRAEMALGGNSDFTIHVSNEGIALTSP